MIQESVHAIGLADVKFPEILPSLSCAIGWKHGAHLRLFPFPFDIDDERFDATIAIIDSGKSFHDRNALFEIRPKRLRQASILRKDGIFFLMLTLAIM